MKTSWFRKYSLQRIIVLFSVMVNLLTVQVWQNRILVKRKWRKKEKREECVMKKEKSVHEPSLRRGMGLKRSSNEKVLAVEPWGG